MDRYTIAIDAGLADGGKDDEGNQLWIGTEKQWKRFEVYQEIEMRELDQANQNAYYDEQCEKEVNDAVERPF